MAEKITPTGLPAAALEIQNFCIEKQWKFCFIGGLAVQAWAEPRSTLDADLTLLTGFGNEEIFIDALLERFRPRHKNAREFAIHNRVLLLWSSNNIGVDIGLGALPFEENSISRSVVVEVATGCTLRVCCAEDLIVHKAFASRELDWVDIETILMRQGRKLDVELIFRELEPLVALKEEPTILERLRELMRKRKVL